jgi:hypothetical protein
MAINVLRGLRNRIAGPTVDEYQGYDPEGAPLPAPSVEAAPRGPRVACPTCGRSLSLIQTTCHGCGLRVVAGVPIQRGALLIVAGSALGVIAGLSLAFVLAFAGRPAQATTPPAASAAPGEVTPGDPALVSGPVPSTAATALRLSVTIEDRLAASADKLKGQVKAKSFSASAAATTIRAIAADATWGSDVVDRLDGWPAAAPLRAQLDAFYTSVRQTARDALGVSIKDSAKYKLYAKRMIKLLGSIATTRTAMEALAAANNLTIPAKPAAP